MKLDIVEKNGKFIVTKDGKPIEVPKNDGSYIVTEFNSESDANRYISILKSLKKRVDYSR
jgi:hypothetical protein